MEHTNANLAALIGSRICHDLISPIGAISNGLELLGMTGTTDGPEMELISDSVGSAGARIRFFRIAFGAASEQALGRAEITEVLRDIGRESKVSVDWRPEAPAPRDEVRMAFLGLLCLETAMPYGGRITVECDDTGWMLAARADKLMIDEALWSRIGQPGRTDGITPAQVQFALLPVLAAERRRAVTAETPQEGQIILRF